jgi:hypothetical protein
MVAPEALRPGRAARPVHYRATTLNHSNREGEPMPSNTEAITIYASCGEFAVPERAWSLMLVLAERYGWQSLGTAPPDEDAVEAGLWRGKPSDWDGRYLPAYGQQVTEEDAKSLAAALERALPDVPDHDALSNKVDGTEAVWGWFATEAPHVPINPIEAFSGQNKEMLANFIAHCREEGGLGLY